MIRAPQEIELDVDTIIVATGYDPYNPSNDQEYNYGMFQNVVTSLEMERMLNASGPTSGKVLRPSDLKEPQRVVYVQCVGSRNERTNLYCSRVCCMYAVKQARQLKEKHPETEVRVFYMDIRAFGKGFEEFYEKAAKDYGVLFTRGRVAEILEDAKSQNLIVRAEDTLLGTPLEIEADLVVLSVGIIPSMDANEIRKILKIPAGTRRILL